MKKYIIYIITGLLLFGTTGCSEKTKEPQPEQKETSTTLPQEMTAMVEPIDSLARCMLENNKTYAPTDTEFFWSALYYFLGEYGVDHPLVSETDDGRLKVPRKVAQEYAIALFANYNNLLPLPETLSGSITFDKDWDAFLLERGDRGLTETVLSDYKKVDDTYTITAKLVSTMEEQEVLGEWDITMQKNVFADGIENPKYFYSIVDMTQISSLVLPPQGISAIFNGLSDNHTVEVTLEDGTIQAFQFYDSTVSEKLHSLTEGDAFSMKYIRDDKTGTLTILEMN
ncbi:hypothetical protein [Anaerotignum sp.]|uniref:hypothetical protein n=1 Tax=Anaerotignum sp. TaxID=2039241 RepID=UPI0028AA73EC|nr:hypothetical protein [Anaerotignum sp.]